MTEELKNAITTKAMTYFNGKRLTNITIYASPVVLGVILSLAIVSAYEKFHL